MREIARAILAVSGLVLPMLGGIILLAAYDSRRPLPGAAVSGVILLSTWCFIVVLCLIALVDDSVER